MRLNLARALEATGQLDWIEGEGIRRANPALLGDVVAVIGSIDIVLGEIDR